ncbi:hypothetical protein VN97_g3344 [Penicillium thymicola]|uniref:Uncharacterized protein n=1 Tax=Penicillium thymicola TaxID=293382 RepID=A0AAI9XAI2_PENTH|nr:hypothetical protein VN97_g3344 [Penicillium thymicola]
MESQDWYYITNTPADPGALALAHASEILPNRESATILRLGFDLFPSITTTRARRLILQLINPSIAQHGPFPAPPGFQPYRAGH